MEIFQHNIQDEEAKTLLWEKCIFKRTTLPGDGSTVFPSFYEGDSALESNTLTSNRQYMGTLGSSKGRCSCFFGTTLYTGPIPRELGYLAALLELTLYFNRLTGETYVCCIFLGVYCDVRCSIGCVVNGDRIVWWIISNVRGFCLQATFVEPFFSFLMIFPIASLQARKSSKLRRYRYIYSLHWSCGLLAR